MCDSWLGSNVQVHNSDSPLIFVLFPTKKKTIPLNLHLICQGNTSWERALYSEWMFEISLWEDTTKSWSMVYSLWKPEPWCPVFLMGCSASRENYLLQSFFHCDFVTRHNHPHNTWTFYPTGMVFPHTYIPLCHQDHISGNTAGEDSMDGS